MSVFDRYSQNAYAAVGRVMGDSAIWIPLDGSKPEGYTANVLYKNPTKESKINDVPYDPFNWEMEFYITALPGLKASTDTNAPEVVSINGINHGIEYITMEADGKIGKAKLQLLL